MRRQYLTTWPARAAVVGLALLTAAIGLCLLDGDELGGGGHAATVDLCNGLALFSFAVAMLGPAAAGVILLSQVAPVYATSLRHLEPPPRFRSFS